MQFIPISDQQLNQAKRLQQSGQLQAAEEIYRQILAADPSNPEVLAFLGLLLLQKGDEKPAEEMMVKAVALRGDVAAYHTNLGELYRRTFQFEKAEACFRESLRLDSTRPQAHNNLALVFEAQNKIEEALETFRTAIRMQPDYPHAHSNYARTLLLSGDLTNGFMEYEWRWRVPGFTSPQRNFFQPQWDGGDIAGKTILLHAEQGLGDAIQFARYATMVSARGATVLLECQASLMRLLKSAPGVAQVFARGQMLPHFEVQCPLLSLPLAFKTGLSSIPDEVPYVSVDRQRVDYFNGKLPARSARRIGLRYAGRPYPPDRSIDPQLLGVLGSIANVRFVSLQKVDAKPANAAASAPLAPLPESLNAIDITSEVDDFADTAALIANLDLVITIDTAVAHVAGALNKPVWTLLPFRPDWRWLLGLSDTPWYPSMRLYRQARRGQWEPVIAEVVSDLGKFCAG